jgi:hypothetical protein
MKAWTFLLLGGFAAACSQHQDLAELVRDGGVMTELPSQACSTSAVDAGTPPPIVAVWDGYMEQSFMSTHDDQVHVVIRSTDTGPLSGTVVFGAPAAPPPPPATSDSCDPIDPVNTVATPSAASLQLLEGFEYQVTALTASDVRLKFNLPTYQPLASWCACQVPIPGSTGCLPNVGFSSAPSGDGGSSCTFIPVDENGTNTGAFVTSCCRIHRCLEECKCDSSGCSYNGDFLSIFDLSVNGTHADGSALHLTRTQ